MEQNSPWKANSRSTSKEATRRLWNQKVRYRVNLHPIRGQMSPIHTVMYPFCIYF